MPESTPDLPESNRLLHNEDVVVQQLTIARTMLARMRGLLGRSTLEQHEGLWITPCTSIHMMFMRFPIDAVFIDRDMHIVRIHERVKPWRFARGGRHAHSVLELAAGTAARKALATGMQLRVDDILGGDHS